MTKDCVRSGAVKPRRVPRRPLLAAPLFATAVLAPACSGRVYTNPGRPEEVPTTQPSETATPTSTPTTTATSAPTTAATTDPGPFAEIPKEGGGHVAKQPDGSCLYVFPERDFSCPPGAHCNPGPPQEPLKVRCPPDAK